MGRHDATRTIRADRVNGYPTAKTVVNAAVREWQNLAYDDGEVDVWTETMLTPSSKEGAYLLIDAHRESHRGDEAVAVPIPRDADIVKTVKKMSVKVSGAVIGRLRSSYSHEEYAALREQIQKAEGKRVLSVKVDKFPARRKPKAVATEGKTVTVYDVVGKEAKWNQESVLATSLATFPAAKAKAVELAADPRNDRYETLVVRARVQRVAEDGTPNPDMAVITRPVADEVNLPVTVTFETIKSGWKAENYMVTFSVHE